MTVELPPTRVERASQNKRRRTRGVKLFVRDIIVIFLAAILISVGIKTFTS